jgi:predicted nucleotidyltransferase
MSNQMLRGMVERIAAEFHPQRIILFGSHARQEADEQSDVDLLVVSDAQRPASEEAMAIRRRLGDFPVACDVLVKSPRDYERFKNVVNHIAYIADRYGKVVYER